MAGIRTKAAVEFGAGDGIVLESGPIPIDMDVIDRSAHRFMVNLMVTMLDLDRLSSRGSIPDAEGARDVARQMALYLRRTGYLSEEAFKALGDAGEGPPSRAAG